MSRKKKKKKLRHMPGTILVRDSQGSQSSQSSQSNQNSQNNEQINKGPIVISPAFSPLAISQALQLLRHKTDWMAWLIGSVRTLDEDTNFAVVDALYIPRQLVKSDGLSWYEGADEVPNVIGILAFPETIELTDLDLQQIPNIHLVGNLSLDFDFTWHIRPVQETLARKKVSEWPQCTGIAGNSDLEVSLNLGNIKSRTIGCTIEDIKTIPASLSLHKPSGDATVKTKRITDVPTDISMTEARKAINLKLVRLAMASPYTTRRIANSKVMLTVRNRDNVRKFTWYLLKNTRNLWETRIRTAFLYKEKIDKASSWELENILDTVKDTFCSLGIDQQYFQYDLKKDVWTWDIDITPYVPVLPEAGNV